MGKPLPNDVRSSLERARNLHARTASDYAKCLEFNALLAKRLDRPEDGGHHREAERVMSLLPECSPRDGVRCDNATRAGERVKKL